jgi:hypothetical protein
VIRNLSDLPPDTESLTLRARDELSELLVTEANRDAAHVREIERQIKQMVAGSHSQRPSQNGVARKALALGSLTYCLLGALYHHPNMSKLQLAPIAMATRLHYVSSSTHTFLKGQGTGYTAWSPIRSLVSISSDGNVSLNEDEIALWESTPHGDYLWD